jgi:LytS/YehU family sensor histidine kinase
MQGDFMKIFIDSLKNVAIIVLLAYPLTKNPSFKRSIIMKRKNRDTIILIILFGSFSILGNFLSSVTSYGILIDSRIVAPVVGGLVAGPLVGFMSGLIGGVYRLSTLGYTMWPDFLANILSGLLGGYVHFFHSKRRFNPLVAFGVGLLADLIHAVLIWTLTEPASIGKFLVTSVGVNVLIGNALGVALFVMIVQDVQYSHYMVGAVYAQRALEIVRLTLPLLENGFDIDAADKIVEIIHDTTPLYGVGIAIDDKIVAFRGSNAECDLLGTNIHNEVFKKALENEMVTIADIRKDIGSDGNICPYNYAMETPLMNDKECVGKLRFYKIEGKISPSDVKFMASIVNFLNMRIKNYYLQERTKLLDYAEFNVLRAQIHPHFLFNTMNVIKVLIRIQPLKAQEMIVNLSAYLRRNLKNTNDLVLLNEEVNGVELYLSLQKARYGERLKVNMAMDENCLHIKIPTFIIQMLVENSLNHGFVEEKGDIELTVSAHIKNHFLVLQVQDNGAGVPDNVIWAVNNMMENDSSIGIGLMNIKKRIGNFYENKGSLTIQNNFTGALVTIRIPV